MGGSNLTTWPGRGEAEISRMFLISFVTHLFLVGLLLGLASMGKRGGIGAKTYQVSLVSDPSSSPALPRFPAPRALSLPAPPPARRAPLPAATPAPTRADPERMTEWWKRHRPALKIPDPSQRSRLASAAPSAAKSEPLASTLPGRRDLTEPRPFDSPYWQEKSASAEGKGSGSKTESAAIRTPGAAGPSIAVRGDNADDPYSSMVQDKISQRWAPPPAESERGEVLVEVGFFIHQDGSVSEVKVEKSSGNFYFDQAALRAIVQASPFPQLSSWTHDSMRLFHVRFGMGALS